MTDGEKFFLVVIVVLFVALIWVCSDDAVARDERDTLRGVVSDLNQTVDDLTDQRDVASAQVISLQDELGETSGRRDYLATELWETQFERDQAMAERDILLDALPDALDCRPLPPEGYPLDCWPTTSSDTLCEPVVRSAMLDRVDEAIIWCLDAGAAFGTIGNCVDLFLQGNP